MELWARAHWHGGPKPDINKHVEGTAQIMRLLLCLSFQINFKFPHSKDVFFYLLLLLPGGGWNKGGHVGTLKFLVKDTQNLEQALGRFHAVWTERALDMQLSEDDIAGPIFRRTFRLEKDRYTVHRTCTEICRGPCPRHSGHWRRIDFPGS